MRRVSESGGKGSLRQFAPDLFNLLHGDELIDIFRIIEFGR